MAAVLIASAGKTSAFLVTAISLSLKNELHVTNNHVDSSTSGDRRPPAPAYG